MYILERVDGVSIPVQVAPEEGCNRTVKNGILTISAAGPDVQPMYDWRLVIGADCDPVPIGVFQGTDDVGTWGFHPTQLSFSSMKGLGSYAAVLEEAYQKPPAITVVHLGSSYRFTRLMRWDDPQGVVFVKVVDQAGQPIAGVRLSFRFANGLEGGGTTPESGEFGTGGVVGECEISITPPEGYMVPASQTNPMSVSVVEGPPIRAQVRLVKI